MLSHVVDPALKTVLEGGIGYYFKVGGVMKRRVYDECLFMKDSTICLVIGIDTSDECELFLTHCRA